MCSQFLGAANLILEVYNCSGKTFVSMVWLFFALVAPRLSPPLCRAGHACAAIEAADPTPHQPLTTNHQPSSTKPKPSTLKLLYSADLHTTNFPIEKSCALHMKKPVARVARPTMFECVCVCVCVEYEYIHEKTQLYRSVAFRYIWLPYAAHD